MKQPALTLLWRRWVAVALCCRLVHSHQDQVVFREVFDVPPPVIDAATAAPRVAIIGGGAAGSSVAWHLRQLLSSSAHSGHVTTDWNITLYEAEARLGGRARTIDIAGRVVEVGATMFVDDNWLLTNLSAHFGLKYKQSPTEQVGGVGIWDGHDFRLTLSASADDDGSWLPWRGWWSGLKFLYRYGWSMQRMLASVVQPALDSWLATMYASNSTAWRSTEDIVTRLNFSRLMNSHLEALMPAAELGWGGQEFLDEFVGGMTRNNYAQEPGKVHAWCATVCLVAASDSKAHSIDGGNWQLFDKMARAGATTLNLNTVVTAVKPLVDRQAYQVRTADGRVDEFDAVAIALPLTPKNQHIIAEYGDIVNITGTKYVHLHVTIAVARCFNAAYFYGNDTSPNDPLVPATILTSAGATSPFLSAIIVDRLDGGDDNGKAVIVNIFSRAQLTRTQLDSFLVDVTEVHRFQWDSYPYLPPHPSYPPVQLDASSRLLYANSFEAAISTMETQVLSGRSAATLLHEQLLSSKH